MTRPASDHALCALKSAFRSALRLAGGGDAFSRSTRVSAAQLSRYGSPDHDWHAPIDVVLDLELDLGQPVVTAALAAAQGYRLVREGEAPAVSSAAGAAAALVGGSAEAFSAVHSALADGRISPRERADIAARMDLLRAQLRALDDALGADMASDDPEGDAE